MSRWIEPADLAPLRSWAEVVAAGATSAELLAQSDALAELVRRNGGIQLCSPEELPGEATVAAVCMIGSPTAMAEVPPTGDEVVTAVQALQANLGRRLDAVAPLDFAGINALWPVAAAAALGIPLVDSDGMGRILPLVKQTVYTLGGLRSYPMTLVGPAGELLLIDGPDTRSDERIMRAAVHAAGGWMICVCYPMTVAELSRCGLTGAVSRGLDIGRELHRATDATTLESALVRRAGAHVLGHGRIVDIEQRGLRTGASMSHGSSIIIDLFGAPARTLRLEVADTPLVAFIDGSLVAAVPDVLVMIDMAAAQVCDLGRLGIGDRVSVVVCPVAAEWHTEAGHQLAGPRSFGIDLDHPMAAVRP